MNILNAIVAEKQKEILVKKSLYPVSLLEKSLYFQTPCLSLKYYLEEKILSGIIAEFKRKSPSQSWINKYAQAGKVTLSYMQAGASALSVLTDEQFFGAHTRDLEAARDLNYCPILRKDFILDEYQLMESKSMGADTVLLIAKILSPARVEELTRTAHSLGMEVLLEVGDEKEIEENVGTAADIIGVNNRNLKDFSVRLENSARLASLLPADKLKVAESGIRSAQDINYLKKAGFRGFLIGTQLMRHSDPGMACKELIRHVHNEN